MTQKIVIISRGRDGLSNEPYYREAIEGRLFVQNTPKACNLIRFMIEQMVNNKEGRDNVHHIDYINSLISNQAPKAEVAIYRKGYKKVDYINRLADYYLKNMGNRPPYITITDKNSDIIILLWDRVPIISSGFNRLDLVLNICKDCGIEPIENNSNILYIHDKEWGIDADHQLYTNTMKSDYITDSEYSEMKKYFNSAIAFQHISAAENITTYDLIRHGTFDSSKVCKVHEIDDALECGTTFKDVIVNIYQK